MTAAVTVTYPADDRTAFVVRMAASLRDAGLFPDEACEQALAARDVDAAAFADYLYELDLADVFDRDAAEWANLTRDDGRVGDWLAASDEVEGRVASALAWCVR